jgi:hypothetical protein
MSPGKESGSTRSQGETMHTRRLRAPSPALVISLLALFVALGGTSLAASNVIASSHQDGIADTRLVKKLAPTLSVKRAKLAQTAAHAFAADQAGSADTATNATNATNATSLGGVSASNYLQNKGNIYFQLGSSNWEPLVSTDPVVITRFTHTADMNASATGTRIFRIDMAIPDDLYGKALAYDGVRICYHTNTGNDISDVSVWQVTQTTDGMGGYTEISDDPTIRTDAACRIYTPASPITLTSADQLSVGVAADWTTPATHLDLGNTTAILSPTTTTATMRKQNTRSQTARR